MGDYDCPGVIEEGETERDRESGIWEPRLQKRYDNVYMGSKDMSAGMKRV